MGANSVRNLRLRACLGAGLCLAAAVLGLLTVGCGGARRRAQQREESNLKPLAILYGRFIGQHRGRPPASEEEFKKFIGSFGKEQLATFNVTDVDSLFVSPRDQKPYVVLYGKSPPAGSARVIAHEQEGQGGTRFVATDLGKVEEVDEARFREMVPGAK